ncbi:DUF934 domain-containing protein [Aromatoleum sp.]|uniref:DUF934 domain-containing protein n=1 Tax=Aromatoleum sp. TaxID=2307007 RepID=UPI002FC7463E
MPKLIKNGRIVSDDWRILALDEDETPVAAVVPAGHVLVPLEVWQAHRAQLLDRAARGEVGVWLAGDDDLEAFAADVAQFRIVAVNFPKFTDGRGYSIATLLRTRYGYTGELRAIGDVLRDQFNYLTRSGFDALQPRADRYTDEQLEAAVANISDFTQPYQASATHPQPLFRRVARPGAQQVES